MKKCIKCKIPKELSEFYKQPRSLDGRAVRCKKCVKLYNAENKERTAKRWKIWSASGRGKECGRRSYLKALNAKRSRGYFHKNFEGERPSSCESCGGGNKVQAHHHDYNLPMDVTFLCEPCHKDWHKTNTPLNRKEGIFTVSCKPYKPRKMKRVKE